jgi:FdhD protein
MKKIDIKRIEKGRRQETEDYIVSEVPLQLIINGQEPLLMPCSGGHINEMITGYLFTTGRIHATSDLRSFHYEMEKQTAHVEVDRKEEILDPQGPDTTLTVPAGRILKWMDKFARLSEDFKTTGAVHTAAVADVNGIRQHFDDIGRHNALDKLIGWGMLQNETLLDKILLLSCRISTSIINKAVAAGFPIIVSTSPPTDRALDIARQHHIALAGFVREERMNIYNREEAFR